MTSEPQESSVTAGLPSSEKSPVDKPPVGSAPLGLAIVLAIPACVVFGLLAAWTAVTLGQIRAPLFFFPVATGVVVGACLGATIRMCQLTNQWLVWSVVALTTLTVVFGEHYFSYLAACRRIDEDAALIRSAKEAFGQTVLGETPAKPNGLIDFMRHEAARGRCLSTSLGVWTAKDGLAWLTWAVDGLLVLLPAALLVGWSLRRRDRRNTTSP